MAGVFLIVLPSSLKASASWEFLALGLFHVLAVLLCHGVWVVWTGSLTELFQRPRARRFLFQGTGILSMGFVVWLLLQTH